MARIPQLSDLEGRGQFGYPTPVVALYMGNDQIIYAPDPHPPQQGLDGQARTTGTTTIDNHNAAAGKFDHGGIPLPHRHEHDIQAVAPVTLEGGHPDQRDQQHEQAGQSPAAARGRLAKNSATHTTNEAGSEASDIKAPANTGHSTTSGRAANPTSTVAATAGAAARLLSGATREMR
jgi:hypothetical protein